MGLLADEAASAQLNCRKKGSKPNMQAIAPCSVGKLLFSNEAE
jgi:hypothetical protein